MVVLNGFQAASDLMNAKGAIYCDRPSQYFIDNIIGWRDSMIILEDGDEYREQRRLFAQAIGTKAALDRFNSIQETHVCWFVNSILKEPGLLLQYTRA
jgi:cytochrome P450